MNWRFCQVQSHRVTQIAKFKFAEGNFWAKKRL